MLKIYLFVCLFCFEKEDNTLEVQSSSKTKARGLSYSVLPKCLNASGFCFLKKTNFPSSGVQLSEDSKVEKMAPEPSGVCVPTVQRDT